jgi:hypothetical protein
MNDKPRPEEGRPPEQPDARSILGLFAHEPELVDEMMKDVHRTRGQGALRVPDDDVEAIRQAVADMDAGDKGIPLDEAFANLRRKYGLGDAK